MKHPKALGEEGELRRRLDCVDDEHIAPLTDFVRELRADKGPDAAIPFIDPEDGGIHAEALFLLEAPGPKARSTGFVSRDNPDETARNFFEIAREAKLDRKRSVTWNAVPWYIGNERGIRPANAADVAAGTASLATLIALLPNLRSVVLMGRKAQRVEAALACSAPQLRLFACPHPSPLFVNRRPENRAVLLDAFVAVRRFLDG